MVMLHSIQPRSHEALKHTHVAQFHFVLDLLPASTPPKEPTASTWRRVTLARQAATPSAHTRSTNVLRAELIVDVEAADPRDPHVLRRQNFQHPRRVTLGRLSHTCTVLAQSEGAFQEPADVAHGEGEGRGVADVEAAHDGRDLVLHASNHRPRRVLWCHNHTACLAHPMLHTPFIALATYREVSGRQLRLDDGFPVLLHPGHVALQSNRRHARGVRGRAAPIHASRVRTGKRRRLRMAMLSAWRS